MVAKKSLFFVNSFTGGGAERVCYDLIRESSKSQEVSVVVLDGRDDYGELPESCSLLNLSIDPGLSNSVRIRRILSSISTVNDFVGDLDSYDVISAHLNMAQLVARLSKASRSTLYVMHGAQQPVDPRRSPAHRLLLRLLYGGRQIVCVSKGIERELTDVYGFDPRCCCTIYNPLDLEKVRRLLRREEHALPGRPFLLAAGRLNKIKRYDRLIDIYCQGGFAKDHDLVILGAGEERGALVDKAHSLGLGGRIHFPGFSSNPYAWMARSEAFICCSDSEAFPVGLLEALFCGARVVSANCDYGPSEILEGDFSEYLVDPIDDVDAYIETIGRALQGYPVTDPASFDRYRPEAILHEYKQRWEDTVG